MTIAEIQTHDPFIALYAVANDYEAQTLDALRERAGLTWEHEGCWTNEASDTTCGRCGDPRSEVARA